MSVVVESKSTERTVYMYFEGWRGAHLSSIVCRAQIFLRKEFCLTDTDTLADMSYLGMSALLAFAEGQASQDAERQYSVAFFPRGEMFFLSTERDALRRASFRWDVFGFLSSFRAFVHCESSTGLVAESDPKPTSLPSNHAKRTDKHLHLVDWESLAKPDGWGAAI